MIRKLKPRADRPKPFGVEWRVDGKVKTECFADETDRDKRYGALVRERKKGALSLVVDRREAVEWNAFKAVLGNADWRDVVAGWAAFNAQPTGSSVGSTVTVEDTCAQ